MRRTRLRRVPPEQLPGFRLTDRDGQIVQAVYRYRALTAPQIEALFFAAPGARRAPSPTRCHYRLQLLYHFGFLNRLEQPVSILEGQKPLVYVLTERGAELVAHLLQVERENLDWKARHNPGEARFLEHLLCTNDVRIALERAVRFHGWTLGPWHDDRTLRAHHAHDFVSIPGPHNAQRRVSVVPDGYFTLDIGKPRSGYFFLELDRHTEMVAARAWHRSDWVRKVHAYTEYYRSGAFTRRYKATNLRVLTVAFSERRLTHLKQATEQAGGPALFWFALFERATDMSQVLTVPLWEIAGIPGFHRLCD